MLQIQKFLREKNSFDDLKLKYSISNKRHSTYNNLVLFKYNQIESPFSEKIVRECRGIILDENNNWNVVAQGYEKFFNLSEGHAAEIDWETAKVYEKVDGSLCTVFWYGGDWHVATTGTPDAGGNINLTGQKFSTLFWETFKQYGPEPDEEAIGYCFFFELTSPVNRIVVVHREAGLTLLGGRDPSGHEITPAQALEVLNRPVPVVKEFSLGSFEDIVATFEHLDPLCQEGYVVCDANFNRVKVKSPAYVALHHAKDGLSLKAFVEIARSGETSEVLAAFPEFAPLLTEAKERVNALVKELEDSYNAIAHLETQKEFALQATKARCSGPLFLLRAKKVDSIKQAIKGMQLDRLMDLLGYKSESKVDTSE